MQRKMSCSSTMQLRALMLALAASQVRPRFMTACGWHSFGGGRVPRLCVTGLTPREPWNAKISYGCNMYPCGVLREREVRPGWQRWIHAGAGPTNGFCHSLSLCMKYYAHQMRFFFL